MRMLFIFIRCLRPVVRNTARSCIHALKGIATTIFIMNIVQRHAASGDCFLITCVPRTSALLRTGTPLQQEWETHFLKAMCLLWDDGWMSLTAQSIAISRRFDAADMLSSI